LAICMAELLRALFRLLATLDPERDAALERA
jgi:hypothetical protein